MNWKQLILAGGLILSLAACNLPSREGVATPTLPPLPTPDVVAIPETGTSCVVGGWNLDFAQIGEAWIESRVQQVSGQQVDLTDSSGSLAVQFTPDGRVIGYANDFNASGTLNYRGANLPVAVDVNGSAEGTYQVDDGQGQLTLSGPFAGLEDVEITGRVLVVPVFRSNLDTLANPILGSLDTISVPFACDGDRLVLTIEEPTLGQRTLELTRAQ
jgi:hypothetical protein